jgi:predicted RNA-binding protein with PUA-like domain
MTNNISEAEYLIAACGLYCGSCEKYRKDKCPGCRDNEKAGWCKIRSCCREKYIDNCSCCDEYEDPNTCKRYNNLISRTIEFFLNTDRSLCIREIKNSGKQEFVKLMKQNNWICMPKSKIT